MPPDKSREIAASPESETDNLFTFTEGLNNWAAPPSSSKPQPAKPPSNNFLFLERFTNKRVKEKVTEILAAMASKGDKYSVILPTYNERQNLPVLIQLLSDVFTKE